MTWTDVLDTAQRHGITVALGGIVSAGTLAYRRLSSRSKQQKKTLSALEAGMIALLGDRLIQLHNHYQERGFCPTYARRSIEAMYRAYKDLGGNGAIEDIYEAIKRMPITEPHEHKQDNKEDK
jgi:hypothetical protein